MLVSEPSESVLTGYQSSETFPHLFDTFHAACQIRLKFVIALADTRSSAVNMLLAIHIKGHANVSATITGTRELHPLT